MRADTGANDLFGAVHGTIADHGTNAVVTSQGKPTTVLICCTTHLKGETVRGRTRISLAGHREVFDQ